MRPSEFVQCQLRVTPYPAVDTGWIIANSGDEICMFSSDFPDVEGGQSDQALHSLLLRELPGDELRELISQHSSIHWDRRTGHVRGVCGADKDDHMSDLLRRRETFDRHGRD
jgi:hypothetical protein